MNFNSEKFAVFSHPSLDKRMEAIRQVVHPSFEFFAKQIQSELKDRDASQLFPIHIAKHLRRTTNPPESTWVAIGGDKRGYKKYPHFQIFLTPHYVFVGLALIDNPLFEKEIAEAYLGHLDLFQNLSSDMKIIQDHTQETYTALTEIDLPLVLTRLRDVKKAELMIGSILKAGDKRLDQQSDIENWIQMTVKELYPLYDLAWRFYQS